MHSYNSMHNHYFVDCFREQVCTHLNVLLSVWDGERGGVMFTYRHSLCARVWLCSQWFVLSPLPSSEESNELLITGELKMMQLFDWPLTLILSSPILFCRKKKNLIFAQIWYAQIFYLRHSVLFPLHSYLCYLDYWSFLTLSNILFLCVFLQTKLTMTWRWPWCAIDRRASSSYRLKPTSAKESSKCSTGALRM